MCHSGTCGSPHIARRLGTCRRLREKQRYRLLPDQAPSRHRLGPRVLQALNELLDAIGEEACGSPRFPVREDNDEALTLAKRIYVARRMRSRYFPDELFSEPAWDILLDLYVSNAEGRAISVSSACIGAAVPSTTALRWLKLLEKKGYIRRVQKSGMRTCVELSEPAKIRLGEMLTRL